MAAHVSYWESWFRAGRAARKSLAIEDARQRHRSGAFYTVQVGQNEHPTCFIEIVGENGYVGVNFLDRHLRDYLVYDFQLAKPGLLFMSGGDFRVFEGDGDKPVLVEQYRFKKEGSVTVTRTNLKTGESEVGSKRLDVTSNYEKWPEFGEYDQLLVRERDFRHS